MPQAPMITPGYDRCCACCCVAPLEVGCQVIANSCHARNADIEGCHSQLVNEGSEDTVHSSCKGAAQQRCAMNDCFHILQWGNGGITVRPACKKTP